MFMHGLEEKLLAGATDKPSIYKRHMGDILLIWLHGEERLQRFVRQCNEQHPDIAFTSEDTTKDGTVPFMDVKFQINSGKIRYELHEKKSNSGDIIPADSAAPEYLKRTVFLSQHQRAKSFSSHREMKERSVKKVQEKCKRSGYSQGWMSQQLIAMENRRAWAGKKGCNRRKMVYMKLPFKTDKSDRKVRMAIKASGLPLKVTFNTKRSTSQGKMTRSKLYPEECPDRVEGRREKRRGRPRKAYVSCGSGTDATEKASVCWPRQQGWAVCMQFYGERGLIVVSA